LPWPSAKPLLVRFLATFQQANDPKYEFWREAFVMRSEVAQG
jgi:hypothetical protein